VILDCWTFELLRVGKDSAGDEITLEALHSIIDNFKPGEIPVLKGAFCKDGTHLGTVEALYVKDGKLMAEVVLNDEGGAYARSNPKLKLAAGMVSPRKDTDKKGEGYKITKATLTDTCLTDQKVE